MKAAILDYPETSAVIIRRHGMYVWGPSWQKAKNMYVFLIFPFTEVIDLLKNVNMISCIFELSVLGCKIFLGVFYVKSTMYTYAHIKLLLHTITLSVK